MDGNPPSIMALEDVRCIPTARRPNREAREEAEKAKEGQADAAFSGLLRERNRSVKPP
jgi:hypothetical protein